jgi:hypothetical protein
MVAGGQFGVHLGDARRRLEQAFTVGLLANPNQDLAYGILGARVGAVADPFEFASPRHNQGFVLVLVEVGDGIMAAVMAGVDR